MSLCNHNLNPKLVFTYTSTDTSYVTKSKYYSLIPFKLDSLLPVIAPMRGDIVSMRGGASSNRGIMDFGNDNSQDEINNRDLLNLGNNDSEDEISSNDDNMDLSNSDSDSEDKKPLENIVLNNLSSQKIIRLFSRFLRFNILNVDLASKGFLVEDDANPTKVIEYDHLPNRRLKSNNSESYLSNDAFKSLLKKYEDKRREGELFEMFKNYVKKDILLLNNRGDPTPNSLVIKSNYGLNGFTKFMQLLLEKVGGNPLNDTTHEYIKTHYLQFVNSDLDKDIELYTFKDGYFDKLSPINQDIIEYFRKVHKAETIEELSYNLSICINNSFFKDYETGPSEVISYVLKYYFDGQEIVITPEARQENRKKPDYVVSEIFQNGLLKPFLTMEVKKYPIKIEDALDQLITAGHYVKHQNHDLDETSGILAALYMGTRILFFELYWYSEHLSDLGIPNYKGIIPLTQSLPT
jgi:hypothetical protein